MTQTSELLLEILSEEIPARMQFKGAEDLKILFLQTLDEAGLQYGEANSYITPRRLVLHIQKVPIRQEDREEEKRGPRLGSPDRAIQGFLDSIGLKSTEECQIQKTPKGDFYIATKFIKGQPTGILIPQLLKQVLEKYTWPKSMRWGKNTLSWVRPIQSVFCLFNGEPVSGRIDIGYDQISFKEETVGHRFHSEKTFTAHDYPTFKQRLYHHHVILDHQERQEVIHSQLAELASKKGLLLRQDPDLLEEVTGLVEWPHSFMGTIEEKFMSLPEEVLITSMRVHQKYFALIDNNGHLANHFVVVANIEPKDGGKSLSEGNERVLRARLSDAKFFFDQDQKTPLLKHAEKLSQSIFHADLGTMAEKVERLKVLAPYIAELIDQNPENVLQAATIAKADLATEVVKEFPELQGIMGYYYARLEGYDIEVAEAIADQYKPKGAKDDIPRSETGIFLALADKIDTIVGMFAIGIKPTGSKDPFALRRAALGSIRLLEKLEDIHLDEIISKAYELYRPQFKNCKASVASLGDLIDEIRTFFQERLKIHWREQGLRHDYISAVFSIASSDPLSVVARRVKALNEFLTRADGAGDQLLAAYRRASNIVNIEEKRDNVIFDHNVNPDLLKELPEQTLYKELNHSLTPIRTSISNQDYEKAMGFVADLRPHIDVFFDQVKVNVEDESIRANRLKLLSLIRDTLQQVADFSKIEG